MHMPVYVVRKNVIKQVLVLVTVSDLVSDWGFWMSRIELNGDLGDTKCRMAA